MSKGTTMTVTHDRFAQGMTYDAYKAQMTRSRDRFDANEQAIELRSDDIAFFAGLDGPVHVLLLAEFAIDTPIGQLPEDARLRLMQAFSTFREEHRLLSNHEVVREIRALVEQGIQQAAETKRQSSPIVGRKASAATQRAKQPIK